MINYRFHNYNPFKKKLRNPDASREGIIKAVREAGIVGMGGAMFPTHVKLSVPKEKRIDTVILNGCECEPYITADSILMQEHAEEVVDGLKLIMKAVGANNAVIAIENNKKTAIKKIIKAANDENIKVLKLKTKYPQGAEKTLIHSVLKRRVPSAGLPLDIGVVVNNVATAKAVYDAVYFGRPLIERLVTVAGAVKQPSNLWVKIGTPIISIIKDCRGYRKNPKKLIVGGPMMGISLESDEFPIIKGNNCILVQSKTYEINNLPSSCIRCSKCIDACPMNLVPIAIASFAEKENFEGAKNVHAMDCYECGACSYVCPQRIAVSDYIKKAKAGIKK